MSRDVMIRPYQADDADATIEIFLRSIREVSNKDYSPAQISSWARVDDREGWSSHRLSRPAWIAEIGGLPVGFADLVPHGYLDMMFVHPEFQGLGVASHLLTRVEQEARQLHLDKINTEASLTAEPFFSRRGFQIVRKQEVAKRGEVLENFLMEKRIGKR
ncbi:GNAT family N-acetyltransferase [Pararhizobium sp.]|uniref:GNAT family N-acetyltransferase n=1 Tax=Pararhizobium sp. TaxID=1977563 RepID=UPI00271D9F6F|nr:GNAT family N-acetyltransferase [Pararhizobium sp.]MDO9418563.1 GNAT family N-acetyltransferase [Pararhizobium sp.]